ncbi:MAG: hypothetical protein Kow0068_17310 [Marinilabiliales bacterium]
MTKKEKASIQESILSGDFSKLTRFQIVKLIFAGIVLIITIIAFIQNFDSVTIKFLFWEFELSVSLLILICVFLGAIISFFREERKIRKKNKIITELQKRIKNIDK